MNKTKKNIEDKTGPINLEDEGLFGDIDMEPIDLETEDVYAESISDLLTDMSSIKSSATLFRDDVIREICSILISENKPNALLIGPAGCGKTNIAEELARRIRREHKSVPKMLYGYRIYSINLCDIVSGCGLVGEVERKVRRLVDYLEEKDNKAILFIDEIHMLFTGETYKKIAQMLKPALSRGRFMVIAATTTQEVKKVDEDPAFNRRFTRVLVDELNQEQTKKILRKAVKGMERHYGKKIGFNDDIAELLVKTADEFCMVGSHRPDNALTLMDRAVASRIMEDKSPEDCIELDKEIVEETAYRMTSGNSSLKAFDEKRFMKAMAFVRGQEEIIADITKTIKLYDLHLRPRKQPLTFLFAGPSGVGKTEIAKIIAREYVGEKPIILNMAEYHSSASINRIIGAPAGYAGFDSNQELPFDALDTNPYQVILLDEFEKCDRSVQRLFMSAFDDGIMKTNVGKEIDFSKTIIIATTNAGCTCRTGSIGFGSDEDNVLTTTDLSEYFDVELLNRFSNRYTFNGISSEVYREIVKDTFEFEIAELKQGRISDLATEFFEGAITDKDIGAVVKNSYDEKLGARPVKKAVREYIDVMLLELFSRNTASHPTKNKGAFRANYEFEYEKGVMTVA